MFNFQNKYFNRTNSCPVGFIRNSDAAENLYHHGTGNKDTPLKECNIIKYIN